MISLNMPQWPNLLPEEEGKNVIEKHTTKRQSRHFHLIQLWRSKYSNKSILQNHVQWLDTATSYK